MNRIGVALGEGRLVAVLPGGRKLETTDTADLARVIADLKRESGLPLARVTVALLPPLVDLRRVSLPPLRPAERRRVIARDIARYFLAVRGPQVVSCEPPFAAAAAAELVQGIEAAVTDAGWRLDTVLPAQPLWATATQTGSVIARLPHGVEHLRVERGELVERTRVRSIESSGDAKEIEPFDCAATAAARVRRHPLELLTEARRVARERASRRFAWGLSAAAVLCLTLAAAVDYWGLNHQLAVLRERRAAIAGSLGNAMAIRDSLTRVATIVSTLRSLDSTNRTWAGFFSELAEYLPRDAHLDAFRAMGDSVALVGVAQEAGNVFQNLERMPRLTAVRADGAIRQDVTATGVVREHFGVSARWGVGTP